MSRRRTLHALWLGALLACLPGYARASEDCSRGEDRLGWYVPDHARLQTGGYLGLFTLGAGYEAFDVVDVDLFYGFVPASVGGTAVHTPALRIAAHVKGVCLSPKVRLVYLRGGVGALMGFGRGFFVLNPDRYPSGYYPITAVRGFVTLGSSLEVRQPANSPIASHGAFIELTALDQYLVAWLESTRTVSALEPWSVSIGYVAGF